MHIQLESLDEILQERGLDLPLEDLCRQYLRENRADDILAFLDFLQASGQLSTQEHEEVQAQLSVELTGLDVFNPFYDRTQLPDQRQGDSSERLLQQALKGSESQTYLLLKQIGAGAMGSIHLAKDRFLRRQVAFKKLLPGLTSPELRERFLGEVQITAQLDHPNVVPIYSLEEDAEGQLAYSMKVVRGISLKEWLARVRQAYHEGEVPDEYTLPARLDLFLKICDALSLAHQKGVIHRDLKPANIMLGEYNEVYVMDWGIARPYGDFVSRATLGDSASTTGEDRAEKAEKSIELDSLAYLESEQGQIVGTPRYMSPEQAGGKNELLDQRSDLFALGLIFFELVCLKQAMLGKDMTEMLGRVIRRQPEPFVSAYGEKLSPALEAIFNRATARRRVERYQAVSELAAEIRRYLNEEPVLAHAENALFKAQRLMHRHRQLALLLMLSSALLGIVLTAGVFYYKQVSLQRAEVRRRQLESLQSELANQGQLLTGRLLKLEGLLQEFSAAARVALQVSSPASEPPRLVLQTGQATPPAVMPPDFARYPGFAEAESFEQALFLLPSTQTLSSSAQAQNELRRLAPLQIQLPNWLLKAQGADKIALPPSQQTPLLHDSHNPVARLSLTLPDGLYLRYPAQLPGAAYEPLQAPLYAKTVPRYDPVWSSLSEEPDLLFASQALRREDGSLLGMAELQLRRQATLSGLLHLPEHAQQDLLLVDAQAQVLMAQPREASARLTALQQQGLKAAFANQAAGYLIQNGTLLMYTQLGRGQWFLLTQVSLKTLLH